MHPPLRVSFRHFLMQDAAAGSHPLDVTSGHFAFVAETVAVLDRTGQHVRDGLDSAMRMPGESRQVVCRILIAEVVQQQKRIELLGLAEAEGALQLYSRSFDGWLGLNHFFDCA